MSRLPLSPEELREALTSLSGWKLDQSALTKTYQFGSFREAMGFMIRVSYEAEALNHHPDWTNVYNRVVVRLHTHDAGGQVTALDVSLARKIEAISWVK